MQYLLTFTYYDIKINSSKVIPIKLCICPFKKFDLHLLLSKNNVPIFVSLKLYMMGFVTQMMDRLFFEMAQIPNS